MATTMKLTIEGDANVIRKVMDLVRTFEIAGASSTTTAPAAAVAAPKAGKADKAGKAGKAAPVVDPTDDIFDDETANAPADDAADIFEEDELADMETPVPTHAELLKIASAVGAAKSKPEALKILKAHGFATFKDVTDDKRAALVAAYEKALAT